MSSTTEQATGARTWSVAEHLDDILTAVQPLEPIELNLLDAQGCVLAEQVTVPVALPPFDNSSMDGYAVRAADTERASAASPTVLTVIGDVAAGSSGTELTVGPGRAARIMTGAPLPPGADAVVPVEWTDGGAGAGPARAMAPHSASPQGAGGQVRVHRPVTGHAHVRARGGDVCAGDVALEAGTVLGPPQIALLAAIGRPAARVRPRPRVVVLSTGSELAQPGEELAAGQIYDSNSFTLAAAAKDAGAIVYRVGAVTDDAETLRATIEDQLIRADLLVTTGGVSVGAYDVVKEALTAVSEEEPFETAEEGAEGEDGEAAAHRAHVEFRTLAMQPGKPQGFGTIGPDRTPILTLPGNPVSSYVSFELFVRPAIRAMMGLADLHRPTVRAVLAPPTAAGDEAPEPLTSPEGKRQFLRGTYTGGERPEVRPVGGSGSHLIGALAHADALIVLPETVTEAVWGSEVEVILLG
ncbi:molybdotransferase-like divisome protein Glp [Streptomyces sp. BBFR102]|uniref:molybdotransferase-like divisome protein Glp n=1 Tax=Streptomyces sp. BBFR102 TaxID=3448171 RepID=UPI003F53CB14